MDMGGLESPEAAYNKNKNNKNMNKNDTSSTHHPLS